jgi:hypothetical protein
MLIEALHGLRRRVKLLGVVYGLGIAVAAGVVLLLATIGFDYLLNLPAWPRLVLILIALGAVSYVIVRWIYSPARSKLSLSDIAGKVESAFPQFDDRLRSTVDFAGRAAAIPEEQIGSDIMRQRVMSEAGDIAQRLDLSQAIVAKPVWHAASAAAGAVLLALLLGLLMPNYSRIALERLVRPFGAPAWPKRVMIEMVGAVPQRIPVGQRVDLRMHLTKGDSASTKAKIFYQLDDGPVQQEYMNRGSDGVYLSSLDAKADPNNKASTLKVWMTAGDDRMDLQPIRVLPRLSIARVEAVVTPPAYVGPGAKAVTINLAEGPVVTAAGSQIALRVAFNKPLAGQANVNLKPLNEQTKAPQIAWQRASDTTVIGTWSAGESLRFHVIATDTDGFENNGLEEYEVIVRPDQMPTVQIENPRRNEERTPIAVVPLQGVADDDYGINTLKLQVDRLNDKKHWEIDLVKNASAVNGSTWSRAEGSGDRLRYRSNWSWDLSRLAPADAPLKPGDVLEYSLLVTDNYHLGSQTHPPVPSGKLRITIVSQEQLTDIITNEMRQLATAIKEIHSKQVRAQQETTDLAKDTKDKPQFDPADRAVADRLTNDQATSAAQTKQIAQKLDAVEQRMEENKSTATDMKQLAGNVKNILNNTAENPMKDAAAQISSAEQQKSPPSRNDTLKNATDNQQRAAEQLESAMEKMGSVGSLQQTIDKLSGILKEQQRITKETADVGLKNLGKTPDQMSPNDKAKLEKAAADQANLARQTDKAIADMNKLSDQMKKSDPASSDAMKQAAQTGQNQQVSPNQSKAAQSARQNQQASAQSAQAKAELGLQMMLSNLREAEQRKLEELQKKLAELQQQLANLIRRQAGHNLDNLGLQGKPADKLDPKLAADLLEKAQREKNALPPQPPLPDVTAAQEQTERNTRDIAQMVQDMPKGAEAASNVTRAAQKMERAIVGLRGKDLPGAYDPPQVDALALLVDAKRMVDEEKAKVDQKRDAEKKEAVRQAYMKIKADQEALNKDTARLDKAKGADGQLSRPDTIRLGQLPGEQGKLADRTKDLDEALAAVNSIVYSWANKDIVTSMNGVKDDLGKRQTGVPTQAEQERIVEQLDAMIKNLEVKLDQSKFAQQGGGGGGGGGQQGPQLPTEAELRLLKSLQVAVNNSTKKIDAQPQNPGAPEKLLALGNRQGDLRSLLDQTLQKASHGKVKLRPEPPNKDQLPEEANKEQVEDQELIQALAGDKPNADVAEKGVMMVGDRMARSRQRLAINDDPGKVTQIIQERILKDLDILIDQSKKQQAQTTGQPNGKQQQGQQMAQAQAGRQVADVQGKGQQGKRSVAGSTAAQQSNSPGAEATQQDLSQQIRQTQSEWGKISPRTRNAVIEGSSEQVLEKYRRYVEEYYKGVAVRGTEQQ